MRKTFTRIATVLCIMLCAFMFAACSSVSTPDPTVSFTVSFDSRGGSECAPVTYEGEAVVLPTPEREGHEFSGWYENSDAIGVAVVSPYTPTADITLYAGWTVKQTPDRPPAESTDPIINGQYSYDLTVGGDLTVDVDVNGGEITSVSFNGIEITVDGYVFADGKLVIDAIWIMGADIGDVVLEITTDKGSARTAVGITDSATAPRFAYEKYVYDLAIGGVLDMKLASFLVPMYVKIGVEYARGDEFAYADGALTITPDRIADIGVGKYDVTAVTATGSASAVLIVINTVKTSFTADTVREYSYGMPRELVFDADFDNVTVSSLAFKGRNDVAPVAVDPEAYSYENGKFKVNSKILDKIYGTTEFTATLSNSDKYTFTVNTNVLFYTDYDVTTIDDGALYVNSNGAYEIVEKESGRALRFMGEVKTNPSYIYQIRNSLRESSNWYGVEMPSGKYVTVDFDYSVHNATGNNNYVFTCIDGNDTTEKRLELGNGESKHARFTLPTDNLRVICVNTLAHDGTSYMDIDNFRVTLVDRVWQGGTLSDYNTSTGGDFVLNFDDCGYAINDVKIDGVAVEYTYENGNITVAENAMPIKVAAHTLTVETAVFTATYTFNTVNDDHKVTLNKTEFDYRYGMDDKIVVGGSFGDKVTVSSLTRKGKHDETPIELGTDMYAFDTATGLTLKNDILDRLYGTTVFTMTASGVEHTFTVTSNVLFYTDYDVTTIHDDALYVNSNGAYEIVEKEGGRALRFMGEGKTNPSYIYQIRNSLRESSNWYGVEMPSGKYVTVDFDYSVHNATGNNNYVFTYIDGNDTTEKRLELGNGESKHARFTLPTDNLRVVCVNTLAHDGTSYMDIDNFRVTLLDSAVTGGTLPEYNNTSGGDLAIPFDSIYAVTDVKIDGAIKPFTYENKTVTIKKSDLPENIGLHNITVETIVFDAVYTINIITDDYKVTLEKTAYDYTYGSGDIAVVGTFGKKVTVSSLTRKGKHDETPIELGTDMYAFDPTTGLTLKNYILDRLYGTTVFTMTASGAEYTFTVTSNVLFYTDYDVTTINDGGLWANSYNRHEIAQTESGHVIRLRGSLTDPKETYVFQIRNALKEPNSNWYGIDFPSGKFITVDFDYSVHNVTGNNVYNFTTINGCPTQALELGNGEVKHAHFVMSSDLNVLCINSTGDYDGTSYMDIDNFRVTLEDGAPQMATAFKAVNAAEPRAAASYGEYDIIGGKKTFDFSEESQKEAFALYSATGDLPFIRDGKLVSMPYAKEQKIIYKHDFSGDMAVSVDIAPIAENYMIDGGIYLNTYGAADETDRIHGLCLNVEKVSGEDKYFLKLHKFAYGYINMPKEAKLDYNGSGVHIEAVIKSGTLYAFADGVLAFSYVIPDYFGGRVGLRAFYAAQNFDNFTVVSGDFDADASALDGLKVRFAALDGDKYFAEGYNALKSAVDGLIDDPISQTYIDRNAEIVSALFDALVRKYDKAELDALSAECAEIDEDSFTTRNSYLSMRSLIERAKTATDETEITDLYNYMTILKDNAVEVKA